MYVAVGQNGVNAEGNSKLHAAALMALTTRQSLDLAFDDATTYCYISRLSVQK